VGNTIDANGALHDAQGLYANQNKPSAGFDLAPVDQPHDGDVTDHNDPSQVPEDDRDAFWAHGYGGQMVGPFYDESEARDHIDTYLDDNSYYVVDGEEFDWDEATEKAAELQRRLAEREEREKMRREDPEGYAQVVAIEQFEHAKAHWTPANHTRALAVIKRMDGVDDVAFDQTGDHCGHCGEDVYGAHAEGCRFDFGDTYNEHLFEGLYPHEAVEQMRAEHDRLTDEAQFYVGVRGMSGPSDPRGERRKALAVALDKVDRSGWTDPREQGITKVRTRHGQNYGKRGVITYKGHPHRVEVYEGVGTQSGTGYVSVKNTDGREIGKGTYAIPKTDGGYARLDQDNLGESIEETAMDARMRAMLRAVDSPITDGTSRTQIRTNGGKAWAILDGGPGNSALYFHGGRTWRGHGGPAFGSKSAQQDAALRRLGDGNLSHGKKTLAQLNEVMSKAQAEHDTQFPPTPQQTKRRRRT